MTSLPTITYIEGFSTYYPDLHQKETEMVRAWRSVSTENTTIKIAYRASIPEYVDIHYDNLVQLQEATDEELTPDEVNVIQIGRQIGYGEMHLIISYGKPVLILGDTFKRVKL